MSHAQFCLVSHLGCPIYTNTECICFHVFDSNNTAPREKDKTSNNKFDNGAEVTEDRGGYPYLSLDVLTLDLIDNTGKVAALSAAAEAEWAA